MNTVNYSCPNCGGKLVFDAERQSFTCEWCMSDFTQENINEIFGSGDNAPSVSDGTASEELCRDFENGTGLYVCTSCGAEIIADDNTAATFCYYCHSPVALKGRLSGKYCPQKVIPFKISKEKAIDGFKEWCGKKLFLPSDFKSQATLEKITGMYAPYWLADCHVSASVIAEAKKVHTVTAGGYMVTTTEHFDVSRAAEMDYMGVPADGSKKLDDALMNSIEPYNYADLTDFSMSYLQGFCADKYDAEKADVLPMIKQRISNGAISALKDDIRGYDAVITKHESVRILKTDWHYMMLPVWFLSYDYRGEKYFYAMNGQTGKCSGHMPISKAKLAIASVIGAVVGIGLGLLIGGVLLA